jgi:nitroreductase
MIKDLVLKNRSYRRFEQDTLVKLDVLRELVDLARLTPSGRNVQPMKYILSAEKEKNAKIFSTLAWAAYFKDWPGPEEGERPAAYIVMVLDKEISQTVICDHGIASQTILLGAVEKGLGGCIIASIKKNELAEILQLPDRYEILFVLAIGKPKENVVVESLGADGNIKYWRDKENVHHVPKRSLEEIIIDL